MMLSVQLSILVFFVVYAGTLPIPGKREGEPDSGSSAATPAAGESDELRMLFPIDVDSTSKWTTAGPDGLPLQEKSTLNWENRWSDPKFEAHPSDQKMSVHAVYEAGSYVPSKDIKGGFGFYAKGPNSVDISTAKEITFGYSVFFEDGFNFVLGGKLPGVFGGADEEGAKGCSGGRGRADCFSSRLMWREKGAGELYPYIPTGDMDAAFDVNNALCEKDEVHCNAPYGSSTGTGNFMFETGKWNRVVQRIKLNDPVEEANAEIEVFYEGESKIKLEGFKFRNNKEEKLWGLQMETFFGGNGEEWASPTKQNAYFADFSVAITQKL